MKKATKAITAIMLITTMFCGIGCTKPDDPNSNLTEGDWVDLGLPSGLLWATRNVGASSPEDYGDYFAWGETSPKSFYDLDTYQYYTCGYQGDGYSCGYTKYCNRSDYGYFGYHDNLTTLQPGDDAATANYGGRMPTREEWQELDAHCTSTWVTINGVYGRCFTGPNGKSLFLPAAGGRWRGEIHDVGGYGSYWTSSLDTDGPNGPWYFNFGSGRTRMYNCSRRSGLSVRAVRSTR